MKSVTIDSSTTTIARARAASRLGDRNAAVAISARYSRKRDAFVIELRNGVGSIIPRALVEGLADATPTAAARIEIVDRGAGLHWAALDVDLTVAGLASGIFGSKT